MQLTPAILIHMTAAIGALVTGPVALWARKGAKQRPKLHKAFGYTWVTLMIVTAISAMFIRDTRMPNILGYTPIHLLVPFTLFSLVGAFYALAKRDIAMHKGIMQRTYIGACLVAGFFTLAPGRLIGDFLGTRTLLQIFAATPVWVWGLLAALLALGYSQTRDRKVGLARVTIMPLVMTAFSLWGTFSTFGRSLSLGPVVAAWFVFAATTFSIVAAGRTAGSYDAASRTFSLPGSWLPMVLILGIFSIRYVSNVAIAMHPELLHDATFALGMAALSGVFSGQFLGRTARTMKLVVRPQVSFA